MAIKKPAKTQKPNKKAANSNSGSTVVGWIKSAKVGESRAYLFEYGLLLLVVGALVGVVCSMFGSVVDNIGRGNEAEGYLIGQSIMSLSSALVLTPVLILLTARTANTEKLYPLIKNTGWRKAFLGIFLSVIAITTIGVAVSHVNNLLSYWVQGNDAFDWRSQLGTGFALVLLMVTALVFGNDYRYVAKRRQAQQVFCYGLALSSLIVSLFFVAGPIARQQDNDEKETRGYRCFERGCSDAYDLPLEEKPMFQKHIDGPVDQMMLPQNY